MTPLERILPHHPEFAMVKCILGVSVLVTIVGQDLVAQQVADLEYKPPLPRPAYAAGQGPRVRVDAVHHNFHTASGRYRPFAQLLRRDGYQVEDLAKPWSEAVFQTIDILVIANPLHERNVRDWSLPTPSAFMPEEIMRVLKWVEGGGSLFLIADHMPFPGAAGELASAFGVTFSNGYAVTGKRKRGKPDVFVAETGLQPGVLTRGRTADPEVTQVATFGGSAFKRPKRAIPVLVFGADAFSYETKRAPGITADACKVPIEGWCQGAIFEHGKGRVAVFGEAAMFSAQRAGPRRRSMGMNAPEAKQNHQLLLNVMHWLSRAEGMPD